MGVVAAIVRPKVPMGFFTGVPFVAALGAAESAGARVAWPHEVVDEAGASLARVNARAGYDEEGVYATIELDGPAASDALVDAAAARVEAWGDAVCAGQAAAGPLAPILNDYFDACALVDRPVEVVRRDGVVVTRGLLVGLDVWGRATVRDALGREVELAPEQASLRLA